MFEQVRSDFVTKMGDGLTGEYNKVPDCQGRHGAVPRLILHEETSNAPAIPLGKDLYATGGAVCTQYSLHRRDFQVAANSASGRDEIPAKKSGSFQVVPSSLANQDPRIRRYGIVATGHLPPSRG